MRDHSLWSTGIFCLTPPMAAQPFAIFTLGRPCLSASSMAALCLAYAWHGDVQSIFMTAVVHSAKQGETSRLRPRALPVAIGLAVVAGAVASIRHPRPRIAINVLLAHEQPRRAVPWEVCPITCALVLCYTTWFVQSLAYASSGRPGSRPMPSNAARELSVKAIERLDIEGMLGRASAIGRESTSGPVMAHDAWT